jgi:hypothetical protein
MMLHVKLDITPTMLRALSTAPEVSGHAFVTPSRSLPKQPHISDAWLQSCQSRGGAPPSHRLMAPACSAMHMLFP